MAYTLKDASDPFYGTTILSNEDKYLLFNPPKLLAEYFLCLP